MSCRHTHLCSLVAEALGKVGTEARMASFAVIDVRVRAVVAIAATRCEIGAQGPLLVRIAVRKRTVGERTRSAQKSSNNNNNKNNKIKPFLSSSVRGIDRLDSSFVVTVDRRPLAWDRARMCTGRRANIGRNGCRRDSSWPGALCSCCCCCC